MNNNGNGMAVLNHYATKRAETENALNSLGTSRDNISEQVKEACKLAGNFAADLTTRTAGQALHDQLTNLPCGIYERHSYKPRTAFLSALAGACGAAVEWDVVAALRLAGDILEDVNAHSEAKQVWAMIDKL